MTECHEAVALRCKMAEVVVQGFGRRAGEGGSPGGRDRVVQMEGGAREKPGAGEVRWNPKTGKCYFRRTHFKVGTSESNVHFLFPSSDRFLKFRCILCCP